MNEIECRYFWEEPKKKINLDNIYFVFMGERIPLKVVPTEACVHITVNGYSSRLLVYPTMKPEQLN